MSRRTFFVIFPNDDGWRVAVCRDGNIELLTTTLDSEQGLPVKAAAVAQLLQEYGYRGEGVALAIPSLWCLWALVSTDALPRQKRYQTLVYRLEEKLPIAAEEFTADFIFHPQWAMGICVRNDLVGAAIDALEKKGIAVQFLSPAALLALQQNVQTHLHTIIWKYGPAAEVFLMQDAKPIGWFITPKLVADIQRPLVFHAETLKCPLCIGSFGLDMETCTALEKCPAVQSVVSEDRPLDRAAAMTVASILQGSTRPWINLRRDTLAVSNAFRGIKWPLLSVTAAGTLFCLIAIAVMLARANHYESQASSLVGQQESLFRTTLPTQAVPVNVHSRLVSEYQRLTALSGNTHETYPTTSSLVMIRDILVGLPGDLRFRITELQITPDQLYVEGQARSHSDAEKVASAIQKSHHYKVESPRTEQLSDGSISFVISGTAALSERPSMAKGISH